MSRGCALLILRSKGQRSRLQCIDKWKWLILYHHDHCLYDTPGLAPRMNVLFWDQAKLRKQGYLAERLKSSFRKFYGRYGDLIQQYEVFLSRMLNDILILDNLIPSLTFTDYEWFPWSICNGCGMPAGNAYPSGHLVPSPIVGLACAPIVETRFLELAMSLLDFSPRIPLGTFSICFPLNLSP